MNEIKLNGTQEFMGINIPIVEGGFGDGKRVVTNCEKIKCYLKMYEILNSKTLSGVYFIRNLDNNYIKIGKSKDIEKRFKEISSILRIYGCSKCRIERVILCSPSEITHLETMLHRHYKNFHIDGEFYNIAGFKDLYTNNKLICYKDELIVNKNFINLLNFDIDEDIKNNLKLLDIMGLNNFNNFKVIKLIEYIKENNFNFCIDGDDNLYYQLGREYNENPIHILYKDIYEYYEYLIEVFCSKIII